MTAHIYFGRSAGGDGLGTARLGRKRHGSEAEAGACVRARMDAAGGTLSASSASGQRVRAYARRYIDEPNVSCTRTPIDARMPNGTPARTSARPHRQALARSVPSFLRAHKLLTARARRSRKSGRVHYACGPAAYVGTSLQQVRRPGWKCGAVGAHLGGVGRGEVLRHLV